MSPTAELELRSNCQIEANCQIEVILPPTDLVKSKKFNCGNVERIIPGLKRHDAAQ